MTKLQQKNRKQEVYSISGFRDTLASPVFYPVIVVSIVLGLASIFGFVQNPLKLKAMVNIIHQKIAETNVVNDSYKNGLYSVSAKSATLKTDAEEVKFENSTKNAFKVFSELNEANNKSTPIEDDSQAIIFDYDVSSEIFWLDLDSSKFDFNVDEMADKEKHNIIFGTPLKVDYHDILPTGFELKGDSIYALNKWSQL